MRMMPFLRAQTEALASPVKMMPVRRCSSAPSLESRNATSAARHGWLQLKPLHTLSRTANRPGTWSADQEQRERRRSSSCGFHSTTTEQRKQSDGETPPCSPVGSLLSTDVPSSPSRPPSPLLLSLRSSRLRKRRPSFQATTQIDAPLTVDLDMHTDRLAFLNQGADTPGPGPKFGSLAGCPAATTSGAGDALPPRRARSRAATTGISYLLAARRAAAPPEPQGRRSPSA